MMPFWEYVPIRYRHQRWVKWIDAHLPASRASVGYYETALRVEREAHLRTRHWLANAQLDMMKKDRQLTTMSRRIAAQRRQIRRLKPAVTERIRTVKGVGFGTANACPRCRISLVACGCGYGSKAKEGEGHD